MRRQSRFVSQQMAEAVSRAENGDPIENKAKQGKDLLKALQQINNDGADCSCFSDADLTTNDGDIVTMSYADY